MKVVEGSFDKAVVDEAVEMKVGSTTTTEEYQYVMDRRTMTLVDDPRQYAFGDPMATMHGSGGYRINFAMGTEASGSYLAYIPEADVTTPLVLVEGPHHHAEGDTTVIDFATKLEAPVAPYYLAHLQALGLPMQITAAQIAPQLTAAGIDVNQALADVAPQLTADESALLAAALTAAIPLNYFFVVDGTVSIEPTTGALIDVHSQQEGVAVQPDLSGVGGAPAPPGQVRRDPVGEGAVGRAGRHGRSPAAARPDVPVHTDAGVLAVHRRQGPGPGPRDDHRHVVGARRDGRRSAWCCWVSVSSAGWVGARVARVRLPLENAPGPARRRARRRTGRRGAARRDRAARPGGRRCRQRKVHTQADATTKSTLEGEP